jgi:hypothetical protein
MQDEDIIKEFGLENFSKEEQANLIKQVGETLKIRVGMKLADVMSDDQLEQFQTVMDSGNEEEANKWLAANVPNYVQLVADEMKAIKSEIKQTLDAVNEPS